MIFIRTDILNPYEREIVSSDNYNTLIDFLQDKYHKGFDSPTDISINGNTIEVDDYDIGLNSGDVIVLLDRTALPVGLIGGWLVTALANLAISVTLSYVANKLFAPDAPTEQASPSSVYSINNAQNTARFGSPIPIIYGKVRAYPSMIAQPFYRFENNIEYLYHVLCVGQGTLVTDNIMIGEDSLLSTSDVEWKLLYKDDFYNIPFRGLGYHITKTLVSPSNMKLINDTSSPDYGESEKYKISSSASKVEFDYFFPNGLSWVRGDGSYDSTFTQLTFRIYTYSSGIYTQVYSKAIGLDAYSIDMIQKTYSYDISGYTEDVYISFEKTYGANDSRTTNDMYIKRVKEIHPNEDFTQLYGDITLLVCKIKATNAVSSAGQVKVNGYFERTDVGNTMSEVLTDIYTNTAYGGALNIDDLSFPTTTETVNCAYDQNMTIFDAMRKPAIAQKYSLYLAGMDVILKKDAANSIVSGMYNELNIIKNSFKVQYLFKEEYPSYDGFECTYIDGSRWIPVSVKYPATSTRPSKVELFGLVDYGISQPTGELLTLEDKFTSTNTVSCRKMARSGSVLIVTSTNNDTVISIDISDPLNIVELDSITDVSLEGARDVAIYGSVAYVLAYDLDAITSIDISDPSNMVILDTLTSATALHFPNCIEIYNGVAYVATGSTYDLVSIDISDPSNMAIDGTFSSASIGTTYGVSISGGIAYVSGYSNGTVTSVDVSNPSSMSELDTYLSTSLLGARGIKVYGSVAYVCAGSTNKLVTIDTSNPSALSELGSIGGSISTPMDVYVTNNVAYVANAGTSDLVTIDVSTPSSMTQLDYLGEASITGSYDVLVYGDYAYISSYASNLVASIDVSDQTPGFDIPTDMAKYLYKQDQSRRKIVSFSTDIQGLVPQFLDKIMVSHNALQWGEAGEVRSVSLGDIVLSIPLTDTTAGKTIVFRNIDGSVSDPCVISITDSTHVTVTGIPAWVTVNTFYTIQDASTAREFVVISVKPSGETVQIDCVNYDETIYE